MKEAMNAQRPQCDTCESFVDTLLAEIQQLQQRIAQLKQKNTDEKRRHSEINNQIIMSNVKYQQALNQAQAIVQKYIREREEYMQKEVVASAQQAELETLRGVNAKIIELLAKSLEESQNKTTKAVVSQLRAENSKTAPKESLVSAPVKGLHVRTDSENNSASYLAAVTKPTNTKATNTKSTGSNPPKPPAKPIKPKKPLTVVSNKPASKPKLELAARFSDQDSDEENTSTNTSIDSNMSIDYDSVDEATNSTSQEKPKDKNNKTTQGDKLETNIFFQSEQTNKRKERNNNKSNTPPANVKSEEKELDTKVNPIDELIEEGRKYGLRRGNTVNYAEPSLNVKMRRGDNKSNIIPEYVVRSYAAPIRVQRDENSPPDDD